MGVGLSLTMRLSSMLSSTGIGTRRLEMPNHYTTVCTVTGHPSLIETFQSTHIVATEDKSERFFDLGTVIPKPDCVEGTESGSEADAGFYALTGLIHARFVWGTINPMEGYASRGFPLSPLSTPDHFAAWLRVHRPGVIEKGERQLRCFRETGHLSWYEWSYANWGTKWNTYQFKLREDIGERLVFEFQTANGAPTPVFKALAARYPGLSFALVTIDEGGPEYVGLFDSETARFEKVEHDADRYRLVYGRDPYGEEDDESSQPDAAAN